MLLERLIFQPSRYVPARPRGIEERWISTADGIRLHAWYARSTRGAPTLLWSHGNGGNIAGRVEAQLAFARNGLNVLAYDYRGYGKSAGSPTEDGVYLDAQAAYDSERASGVPAERIVAFGESLGGAVSIQLACTRPCAALGVVSTFTTIQEVAWSHFGPLALLAGDRFNSLARIKRISIPILIAHGDRDEVVPFALGEQLFRAANQPKRFVRAKGAHHNDVFAAPGLIEAITSFALEATRSR